jgi:hypothetical protein
MIVTLPDNGVSAPPAARSSSSTDKNEGAKSQSATSAREAAPRDASGHALQNLFNVTIDCVRGRYDR